MQIIAYKCDRCGFLSEKPLERQDIKIVEDETCREIIQTVDLCYMCADDKTKSDTRWFYRRD